MQVLGWAKKEERRVEGDMAHSTMELHLHWRRGWRGSLR